MSGQKPFFSLQNVTCVRQGRILFQNISFDLQKGDVLHVSGNNGSGKTSLLRLMMGALPCSEGDLFWEGAVISENISEVMTGQSHFIPANDGYLKTSESVMENLMFWADVQGVAKARTICEAALFAFEIEDLAKTPVHYLSQGQRRRVSLSRVLLSPKSIWLLDEPVNGLDTPAQNILMSEIEKYNLSGGSVVIAGHQKIDGAKTIHLGEGS